MWIVIEKFGGPEYAVICTDGDGNNLVFETAELAQNEADECQDAVIVEI